MPFNLSDAYDFINANINEDEIVQKLINDGTLTNDDIQGYIEDPETGVYPDIYQWLKFTKFTDSEYQKLITNNIPVINSEYGSWVGITSYGMSYDDQVYPELIQAIYNIKVSGNDIFLMKRGGK